MIRLAAILMSIVLSLSPTLAQEADGAWECRSFGVLIATVGIDGEAYVLANPHGQSGRGTLGDVTGSFEMFVVQNGPLLDSLQIVGGRMGVDRDEPLLTLLRSTGEDLYCYLR